MWRNFSGESAEEKTAENEGSDAGDRSPSQLATKYDGLKICQDLYDDLKPYFEAICERQDPPWDVDKAFPAPPGMDKVRQLRIKTQERHRDASPGARDFSE
jgi:hypothetical protein